MQEKVLEEQEELYSRQHHFGSGSMAKLMRSRILVIGGDSLGVEIVKNLTLQGVRNVVIFDKKKVTWNDVECGFVFHVSSVPQNLDRTCEKHVSFLDSLNPHFGKVESAKETKEEILTSEYFSGFDVVINSDPEVSTARIVEICQSIRSESGGLERRREPDVRDVENKDESSEPVVDEVPAKKVPKIIDAQTVGLTGRVICFGDELEKTTLENVTPENMGDICHMLRHSRTTNKGRSRLGEQYTLHLCYEALSKFTERNNNRPPRPYNEEDSEKFYEIYTELLCGEKTDKEEGEGEQEQEEEEEIESQERRKLVKMFSFTSSLKTPPLVTLFGGFASSEALKIVLGKECLGETSQPLGLFCFNGTYILPSEPLPADFEVKEDEMRHVGMITVFGREFNNSMRKKHVFIPGIGAIGCETLKLVCQLGISPLTLCDYDRIEISNTSRQFLFREVDKGDFKCSVAKKRVMEMFNTDDESIRVVNDWMDHGKNLDDEFYRSVDLCVMGFDSFDARELCQEICRTYGIPLLNSGTLGWRGNSSTHFPGLTHPFTKPEESSDDEVMQRMSCTGKNDPQDNRDVIMFVRNHLFVERFFQLPSFYNGWIDHAPLNVKLYEVKCAKDAVYQSLIVFYETFTAPKVGYKSVMNPVTFDAKNRLHTKFIELCGSLFCKVFGLENNMGDDIIMEPEVLTRMYDEVVTSNKVRLTRITKKKMKNQQQQQKLFNAIEFERENPLHVDFLTVAGNIRRQRFPKVLKKTPGSITKKNTKQVAGQIFAASASIGSISQGLVLLEFIQSVNVVVMNNKGEEGMFRQYSVDAKGCQFRFSTRKPRNMMEDKWWAKREFKLSEEKLRTIKDLEKLMIDDDDDSIECVYTSTTAQPLYLYVDSGEEKPEEVVIIEELKRIKGFQREKLGRLLLRVDFDSDKSEDVIILL